MKNMLKKEKAKTAYKLWKIKTEYNDYVNYMQKSEKQANEWREKVEKAKKQRKASKQAVLAWNKKYDQQQREKAEQQRLETRERIVEHLKFELKKEANKNAFERWLKGKGHKRSKSQNTVTVANHP